METDKESSRGFVDLEGYLRGNAELAEARCSAARFADQIPWLTAAQREDIERIHVMEQLAARKEALVHITGRVTELRKEYAQRYSELRRRCVATAVVVAGATSGACGAVTFFGRS